MLTTCFSEHQHFRAHPSFLADRDAALRRMAREADPEDAWQEMGRWFPWVLLPAMAGPAG